MRILIYIPIIHSGPDMGSMADELTRKGIAEFGERFWQKHVDTVRQYWDAIARCCESLGITKGGFKIYQDGMVADGEIAMKIIIDSVKAGSRNYEIIAELTGKGAVIEKTEDFDLVRKEVEMLKTIPASGALVMKLIGLGRFKILRSRLLRQRDRYIARRIEETLGTGETGLIFLGAYHSIINKLHKDICVIEMKEIGKVRQYQQTLPFYKSKKEKLEELSSYLIEPIGDFNDRIRKIRCEKHHSVSR